MSVTHSTFIRVMIADAESVKDPAALADEFITYVLPHFQATLPL